MPHDSLWFGMPLRVAGTKNWEVNAFVGANPQVQMELKH